MKSFSLSVILDGALSAAIVFFASRALMALFISSNALSLALSAIAGIAASATFSYFKIKRNKKLFMKNREQKMLNGTLAEFEILRSDELLSWFCGLFCALNVKTKKHKNKIVTHSGCECFFDYSKSISREKAAELLKKIKKSGTTLLFCNNVSEDARALFKSFSDNLYLAEPPELFSLMKKANYFYEPKIFPFRSGENKKTKLKRVFKRAFTKKRAAVFTLAGITALAFSPFTFLKTYYLIYALLCFIFAAFCLIFGKKTINEKRELPVFFDDNGDNGEDYSRRKGA